MIASMRLAKTADAGVLMFWESSCGGSGFNALVCLPSSLSIYACHDGRKPTYGYDPTREPVMTAFADGIWSLTGSLAAARSPPPDKAPSSASRRPLSSQRLLEPCAWPCLRPPSAVSDRSQRLQASSRLCPFRLPFLAPVQKNGLARSIQGQSEHCLKTLRPNRSRMGATECSGLIQNALRRHRREPSEAVREHERLGADLLRDAGEQFERAGAIGLDPFRTCSDGDCCPALGHH
jgi:hypothetical protein